MAIFSDVFKFVIIGLLYVIIFVALRIMYKDIKIGSENKRQGEVPIGLEIIGLGASEDLVEGTIIPVSKEVTIGRKEGNSLVLNSAYVSGKHAKINLKNGEYFIEDLGSTNGTLLNNLPLKDRSLLKVGDEIKIGEAMFKVID